MRFIADLHIHSRYSRATSRDMELESLAIWGKKKGITLLGTGDFTHPTYFAEMRSKLEPFNEGIYVLKRGERETKFMLTTEVSNIFTQGGKVRKVHTLIFAPNLSAVEGINDKLRSLGKLGSDGRPIFGFFFGANSGFDSLEECFEEEVKHIFAIETGLSSDPEMNWRLSALDNVTLISNSDAHSLNRLGREANVFDCPLDYREIVQTIRDKDPRKFLFSIEFFPEEGKYHFDGHRNCAVIFSPVQTKANDYLCPVCKKRLTVGVMHRVEEMADRPAGFIPGNSIPSIHLVPLEEIIAESLGVGVGTKAVEGEYERLIGMGSSELAVLLDLPPEELKRFTSPRLLEGIIRMRQGKLHFVPGHDGVYGKINIFSPDGRREAEGSEQQMSLF
ncbi:MAG: hypothetical protein A7315_01660 [Candidatus Altiarchaeales archaeon WOR_SM1_79]|nr:MAG: hypothetical protein A7315_01660 [Candidatus Altiarchaeales archaeon WOR_SM1_79]